MTKRIQIEQLVGNYMDRIVERIVPAWTTSAASRWSAVKLHKSWSIYHRASAMQITSLTGRTNLSLNEALACIAALDALETDWSAFDALPPVRYMSATCAGFGDNKPAQSVVDAMREAIRCAL